MSQPEVVLGEERDAGEGVGVEAGLLQPQPGPASALSRKPAVVTVGFVVLAAGAAAVAMGPGKLFAGPKKVRTLSDSSQLWIRRDLQSIDWEPPCFELHKSIAMNTQAAWDSFMEETSMKDELTDYEYKEFEERFKAHVATQTKGISAETLHESCDLWAEFVKEDLQGDKPLVSEALVTAFNEEGHSFTVAITPSTAHLSHSDLQWHLGASRTDPPKDLADHMFKEEMARRLTEADLPDDFNTASQWPQCEEVINRVHQQGTCGSCWAFGATHALDSRLCIATNGGFKRQLSRTQVTACTYDQDGHNGCEGGWETDALNEIATNGIPTGGLEGCNPYFNSGDGTQHFSQQDAAPACPTYCHNHNYHREFEPDNFVIPEMMNYQLCPISTWWETQPMWGRPIPTDWKAQIKQNIMEGGPVPSSVACDDPFMIYAGGVYDNECDPKGANHVVSTIGWGSLPQEHFVIMNSWGHWGDGGSGKMKLIPKALCDVLLLPHIDPNGEGLKLDGLESSAPTPEPGTATPAPAPTAGPDTECEDSPADWEDSFGDSCDDYKAYPSWCEWYADETNADGVTTSQACCACNGGTSDHLGGEEAGETDDEHVQTESGYACAFPFVYKGSTYHSCTLKDASKPWCATLTYDDRHVLYWDYCVGSPPSSSFTVKSGPCQLGVGDYTGCVLNEYYGNDEQCTISVPSEGVTVYSHMFMTESGYDKLFINGEPYSGWGSISGKQVTEDIMWVSDDSYASFGWIICDHAP